MTPGALGVLFGGIGTLVLLCLGLAAVLRRKYGVRRAALSVDHQDSRDISEYGCVRINQNNHSDASGGEFLNLNTYGDHVNSRGSLIVNTDIHDHELPIMRGPAYRGPYRENRDISTSHISSEKNSTNVHANPIFQSFQKDDSI